MLQLYITAVVERDIRWNVTLEDTKKNVEGKKTITAIYVATKQAGVIR